MKSISRNLIGIFLAATAVPAAAHDAPTGWSYPASCCSNLDCRMVRSADVKETTAGYWLTRSSNGEIVPYGDTRIKDSPDGEYHWCTSGGTDDGRTLCLFVPPRAF